jgi:release factor H-coupled RctB family protein
MGLFKIEVPLRKFKPEKWESRLEDISDFHDVPVPTTWTQDYNSQDFGTIGGGNHFLEFQRIENISDPESLASLNIDKNEILMLVHTGSRGFGQKIINEFNSETGYDWGDHKAQSYLELHDQALVWAQKNRAMVAVKILNWLGLTRVPETLINCAHNYMEKQGEIFIHRKGAISTQRGLVIIPGSRGSLTYLVKPTIKTEKAAWSISHGAGRKWARSLCQSRLSNKYNRQSIKRTTLQSRVICRDLGLLFQEAPEAYKNIGEVIASLLEHGLIEIVATLRPLLTYKG